MKTLFLTGAALAALAAPLWAQAEHGFVANELGNSVTVFDPANLAPALTIPVGQQPRDILAVESRRRIYVSNGGAVPGTISIISADTLAVVNTVTVPSGVNLAGMSLSADKKFIYIAGRNPDNIAFPPSGQAGVFALDLDLETAAYVGGLNSVQSAADCAALKDSAIGGTNGDVTGRILFTLPADNLVGMHDFFPPSTTPLSVPAEVQNPTNMDRMIDHSNVYVTCADGPTTQALNLLGINSGGFPFVVQLVVGAAGTTHDVELRPGTGTSFRVYITGEIGGVQALYEWDGASVTATNALGGAGAYSITHHQSSLEDRLYLGEAGSGVDYITWDSSPQPIGAAAGPGGTSGGGRPQHVAFALQVAVAPAEKGFASNESDNTVIVFDPATGAWLEVLYGGPAPRSILIHQALRKAYVANGNGGISNTSVTIISVDTLATRTVTTAGVSFGGMSLAPDGSAVFIAGTDQFGFGNVFRLDTTLETFSTVTAAAVSVAGLDCVVVPASAVGGSGNAPGRLYWTTNDSAGLHRYDLINNLPMADLSLPANLTFPTQMDGAPDHGRIYAACASATDLSILKIEVGSDITSEVVLVTGVASDALDVVFRPETAIIRAYVLVGGGGMDGQVQEVLVSGSSDIVAVAITAAAPPPGFPNTISHHAAADVLYVAGEGGGVSLYQRLDSSASPPSVIAADRNGGEGVRYFAFVAPPPPAPAPIVTVVSPKGGLAGTILRVEGANFAPTSRVRMGTGAAPVNLPTTFVDSGTLLADTAGFAPGIYDVEIQNTDSQTDFLEQYFAVFAGPPVTSALTLALPSATLGYQMLSVPQYASPASLLAALQAQLGPYSPSSYRVFVWSKGAYAELPALAAADPGDLAGRAFWIVTRFGGSFTMSEPDVESNTAARAQLLRVIPLDPGWNMISLPYYGTLGQMFWANVSVTSDGANLASAAGVILSPALISPNLFEYGPGGYVTTSTLERGKGYFVYNQTSGPIYLVFNTAALSKPAPPGGVSAAPATLTPPPPPMGLGVTRSSSRRSCGMLGIELLLALALLRLLVRREKAAAAALLLLVPLAPQDARPTRADGLTYVGFPDASAPASVDRLGTWKAGPAGPGVKHWVVEADKTHVPLDGAPKTSLFRGSLPFPQTTWTGATVEVTQLLFPVERGFAARYHVMNHGDSPTTCRLVVGLGDDAGGKREGRRLSGSGKAILVAAADPVEGPGDTLAFDLSIEPGASKFVHVTTPDLEGKLAEDALDQAAARWETLLGGQHLSLPDAALSSQYCADLAGDRLGVKGCAQELEKVRAKLFRKEGDALRILPEAPEAWMLGTIVARNVPTEFGPLTVEFEGAFNSRMIVLGPDCKPPGGFVLEIPKVLRAVVDGKKAEPKDGLLRVPSGTRTVEMPRRDD